MTSVAIVDAGPLYAAADEDDEDHQASIAVLSRADLQFVVPALVITEATYFVGRRLGAAAESAFVRGLAELDVEAPTREDLIRMSELVRQYAGFPLGAADASVVALAERLNASLVVTLDRKHFAAIVPQNVHALTLLP
ncbi:MAG TPA: PIN domain-containing protein [Solirubrobacteraceae bacterium]|nr:PIN domain-containing protein [Solirubrobacteraceae bacterium]